MSDFVRVHWCGRPCQYTVKQKNNKNNEKSPTAMIEKRYLITHGPLGVFDCYCGIIICMKTYSSRILRFFSIYHLLTNLQLKQSAQHVRTSSLFANLAAFIFLAAEIYRLITRQINKLCERNGEKCKLAGNK